MQINRYTKSRDIQGMHPEQGCPVQLDGSKLQTVTDDLASDNETPQSHLLLVVGNPKAACR